MQIGSEKEILSQRMKSGFQQGERKIRVGASCRYEQKGAQTQICPVAEFVHAMYQFAK